MKFSFVVPVYNIAPYLRECIDSLLAQDTPASECEIVAVNDGSTDESPAILREYEAANPGRFVIIDQPNAGLGPARNTGLARARGEYVWFVDSDDVLRRNSLPLFAAALDAAAADGAGRVDVVCTGFMNFTGDLPVRNEEPAIVRSSPAEAMCCFHCMAWNKVFSREFLLRAKLEYPAVRCPEDIAETHRVLAQARNVLKTDAVFYFYRQRPGSIVRTINERVMSDMTRLFRELGGLASSFPELRAELAYCYWKALDWHIKFTEKNIKSYDVEAREAIVKYLPVHREMLAAATDLDNPCICLDKGFTFYYENQLDEKNAEKQKFRDNLDKSLSWRITKPLRALADFASRIRGGRK